MGEASCPVKRMQLCDLGRMPQSSRVDEKYKAKVCRTAVLACAMSGQASVALPSEPMKGFKPETLDGLRSRLVRWRAVWRLRRWCTRITNMPESDFAAELVDCVVTASLHGDRCEAPLTWLYRAMRDAAPKTGSPPAGVHPAHSATHVQPLNVRLAASITSLPPDQHTLLAIFMYGARCEDVAKWEGTSQEDVADRISQIARELAVQVFGTAK